MRVSGLRLPRFGRRALGVAPAFALILSCAGAAHATHLDSAACAGLQADLTQLAAAGTRQDMHNGADWAKANLGKDRLDRIARLIEVEEQIAFRCQPTRFATAPPAEAAAGEPPAKPANSAKSAVAAATALETVPPPKQKKKRVKADEPAATSTAADDNATAKPHKTKHTRKAASVPAAADAATPPPSGQLQAPAAGN